MSSYVSYLVIQAHNENVFSALKMSSYLVIRMHNEDVVFPCCKCPPTCLTSSSEFTKKTLFFRIPNVILRVLPWHPDAQRRRSNTLCLEKNQCPVWNTFLKSEMIQRICFRVLNVILRVLPRHPDAQRRRCFSAFQMSSYVSYLVIRMHKEDDALSRCFPFDLFRRNRHPRTECFPCPWDILETFP